MIAYATYCSAKNRAAIAAFGWRLFLTPLNYGDSEIPYALVKGGRASLDLSLSWIPRLPADTPLLLAVQNGMVAEDVVPHLNAHVGIFLGGDTEWKFETGQYWGNIARERGVYYHVGRVNTYRRIIWCHSIGAHSFDGTSVSRYSKNIHKLDAARRQQTFFGG